MKKNKEMARKLAIEVDKIGGRAYYVGGFVRDDIMGVVTCDLSIDIDIEVHGVSKEALHQILEKLGDPISIGKAFGIMSLKNYSLDIALPRTEVKTGVLHTDFDVTIDEKMGTYTASKRRDFTINAIMKDILTGEVIDHFGGLEDIENKLVRHISDDTFVEDPLRVLRACSFAARLGFDIDIKTVRLCKTIDLKALSKERIFAELVKVLEKSNKPSVFFRFLDKMNHLEYWFKELYDTKYTLQNPTYHAEGSVFEHTMMVLDEASTLKKNVSNSVYFMFAALCHDLGKNVTTKIVDGKIKSTYHEIEGMDVVETFLRRFTDNKKLIKYVQNMVCLHMRPNVLFHDKSRVKKTNKLFDKSTEPADLIYLSIADNLGRISEKKLESPEEFLFERLTIYNEIMDREYVSGDDLIAAGIEPDKKFKDILEYAHKLRLAGIDKESALKQVIAYAKKKG